MRRILDSWFVVLALLGACQSGEAPLTSSTTSAVAGTDRLNSGEALSPGQSIGAGGTVLVYQGDNNLVLYQNGAPLWATMAALGSAPNMFVMQGDCNAVVYNTSGPVWASGTNGQGSSCYAQVIEGDWFICSGTSRVFTARGGGSCGGGGGGGGGGDYQCMEPSLALPIPFVDQFHVRAEPDFMYVCDTRLRSETHVPWPQLTQSDFNDCVGACGKGCSDNTCTRFPTSGYFDVGGGKWCRDVHYDCYSTDCCWYHDLCGRLADKALYTDPFCSALAAVYGCAPCIDSGFNGCSGPGYTRSFDVSHTEKRDCCDDRPGDCWNDCTGQCQPGCDANNDCFDDCTGAWVCGDPFCPDFCQGLCGGFGWCAFGGEGVVAGDGAHAVSRAAPTAPAPALQVRIGDQSVVWSSDELTGAARPLADVAALAPGERDGLGARTGWSLRDLVHEKLGGGARVAALIDGDGQRVELDAAAWDSTDTTPILRLNHKGQLRFHWVGVRNRLPGAKGVQRIEIVLDRPAGASAR